MSSNLINSNFDSTPHRQNSVVERGLDLRLRAKQANDFLKWGTINIVILAVLLYDISNKCPYAESVWFYVEYAGAAISALSVLACFLKYFIYLMRTEPIQGTEQQKSLLQFQDNGNFCTYYCIFEIVALMFIFQTNPLLQHLQQKSRILQQVPVNAN